MHTVPPHPKVWAIVVGAGAGTRFGGAKQYELLGSERVLDRSARIARQACDGVVLVVPPGDAEREGALAGGPTRAASVGNGLAAVPADVDVICVHDAARPLATAELYRRVVAAVCAGADAAVPGLPVSDTVKQVAADGTVLATPDRATLVTVQTPQAFAAAALRAAHADPALTGDPTVTDDAMMIERRGGRVVVVPGEPENCKITLPGDLVRAREVCS